jgi:ABC-type polysaccharide/polyol phosphate export permease
VNGISSDDAGPHDEVNRISGVTERISHPPHAAQLRARDRALFVNFFKRELTTRYLGSVTGIAWALLNPLALLGVYHFVFTHVFRATGFAGQSFLAFVAIALWPWLAAQEALQRGVVSLAGYSGMIRKVAFPHELVIFASVAATFVLQFAGYVVILIVLRVVGEPIHLSGIVVAIPVWLVLLVAVTGLTLLLSALQVFIRDVEHVLMPLLMMLMYLTPILYPLSLVPEGMRSWVALNPFNWVVTRLRDAFMDGRLTPSVSDFAGVIVAVLLFLGGRWVFRRLSPHFEDFV